MSPGSSHPPAPQSTPRTAALRSPPRICTVLRRTAHAPRLPRTPSCCCTPAAPSTTPLPTLPRTRTSPSRSHRPCTAHVQSMCWPRSTSSRTPRPPAAPRTRRTSRPRSLERTCTAPRRTLPDPPRRTPRCPRTPPAPFSPSTPLRPSPPGTRIPPPPQQPPCIARAPSSLSAPSTTPRSRPRPAPLRTPHTARLSALRRTSPDQAHRTSTRWSRLPPPPPSTWPRPSPLDTRTSPRHPRHLCTGHVPSTRSSPSTR